MASTEQIEAMLAAYVDGELDAAGIAEIEQHLTKNPQHRVMLDEMRQAKRMIGELPHATAPADLAEALAAQLERGALLGDVDIGVGSSSAAGISRWPQFGAIAAVLLLTGGLAFVLYQVLPSATPNVPHVATIPRETVPRDLESRPRPENETVATNTPDASRRSADADEPRMRSAPDNLRRGDGGAGDRAFDNVSGLPAGGAGGGAGGGVTNPASGGLAAAAADRELVLVVHAPDPHRANDDVVNFLAVNRIKWTPLSVNAIGATVANAMGGRVVDSRIDVQPAPTTSPVDNAAVPAAPSMPSPQDDPNTAVARREADRVTSTEPTTAPGYADSSPRDASREPATAPAAPVVVAESLPPDAYIYAAKMTAREAELFSANLSQPQKRQQAILQSEAAYALQLQQQQAQQGNQFAGTREQQEKEQRFDQPQSQSQSSPTMPVQSPQSAGMPEQTTTAAQAPQAGPPPAPVVTDKVAGASPSDSSPVADGQGVLKEKSEERKTSDSEVLAAGDTVRIRAASTANPNDPPAVDDQQTIDDDGNVTLPGLGMVKAAGLTGRQVSGESIPQIYQQSKDMQQVAPIVFTWTIEKLLPADPTTRPAGTDSVPAADARAMSGAELPSTNPAEPSSPSARLGQRISPEELVDVVIVVQRSPNAGTDVNADRLPPAPANVPATTGGAAAAGASQPPAPTTGPTTLPTTQPSPATPPTDR